MAHEIELFADGTAGFVSARQDAWHRLGTVLDDTFTAEQAMTHAKLGGWDVRKTPLTTSIERPDQKPLNVPVPGKFATVRTNPVTGTPDVLGVVGDWWTPIQNEEHCELLNTLVSESGAHFETAGSLRDGREVFLTMKLPKTMRVGGIDAVDTYIAALNSHDGMSAFRLLVTPVRIVCANTQAAALRGARSVFNIRHTSSASQSIALAREALGLTFKFLEDFEAEAEKMINATMRDVDFTNKVRKLMPYKAERAGVEQGARAKRQYDEKIVMLRDLFTNSPTNVDIRGTRWAGYQAVTEYLDHFSPVAAGKGADKYGVAASDMRAEKTLTKKPITDLKIAAFRSFAVA